MSFTELVAQALDELPERFALWLDNVEILVEDEPPSDEAELLGLYQGVPLTERGDGYTFVLPDTITLFEGPLRRMCVSDAQLRFEVKRTVVHELAHHFGIDDDRLDELGWA